MSSKKKIKDLNSSELLELYDKVKRYWTLKEAGVNIPLSENPGYLDAALRHEILERIREWDRVKWRF